ncbi:hypothetical protein BDF21DRAFT_460173 [Thamnidium elegans]|nr:hypothetical protein BDF21DRAFT_460173 [Thamnidium elegans]
MDPEVLRWITKHVEDRRMHWKCIKNALRLNEGNLDDIDNTVAALFKGGRNSWEIHP